MTDHMPEKRGMTWWSTLSAKEKDAAVEPLIREGKSNREIAEMLRLTSSNMVAGPRHRINHRDPDYVPTPRPKKQRPLPKAEQAEAVRTLPAPTLAPLTLLTASAPVLPSLEVIRNPDYKPEWQQREEETIERVTRQIIGLLKGTLKFPRHLRPFARLDTPTRREVRRNAQRFVEWR